VNSLSATAVTVILSSGVEGKCALLNVRKLFTEEKMEGFIASELIPHAHLIHEMFQFCIWLFNFRNTYVFMIVVFCSPHRCTYMYVNVCKYVCI
jgi:hypothetical protein